MHTVEPFRWHHIQHHQNDRNHREHDAETITRLQQEEKPRCQQPNQRTPRIGADNRNQGQGTGCEQHGLLPRLRSLETYIPEQWHSHQQRQRDGVPILNEGSCRPHDIIAAAASKHEDAAFHTVKRE